MTTKVWISVLIPTEGADVYDGARVQASLAEQDCYEDLADWLDIEFESKAQVEAALDDAVGNDEAGSHGIEMWKVEEQEIFEDFTQTDLTKN